MTPEQTYLFFMLTGYGVLMVFFVGVLSMNHDEKRIPLIKRCFKCRPSFKKPLLIKLKEFLTQPKPRF